MYTKVFEKASRHSGQQLPIQQQIPPPDQSVVVLALSSLYVDILPLNAT